jgi:oxygen-independent coproporphyrinogen-3 oxidase
LRAAGVANINIDLIAGLPHQTAQSWEFSLQEAIACGVPHVSVYMLEVDEDSRLGRELLAGGAKYHAHFVPDDDLAADLYETACARLEAAGIPQYEISNFARQGMESRHNLKYWTRQPYLGFGVDAHSMLAAGAEAPHASEKFGVVGLKAHASTGIAGCCSTPATGIPAPAERHHDACTTVEGHGFSRALEGSPDEGFSPCGVRFATPDSLQAYLAGTPARPTLTSPQCALEESFFLGLRLNEGVDLHVLEERFGTDALAIHTPAIQDLKDQQLLEQQGSRLRLTPRGRLISNEVFERFIALPVV